ncbi:MAG: HIT family protein [Nanoarchaeota archaeon]|nr:HIT family protein [Nanoarchaeota archaeon]
MTEQQCVFCLIAEGKIQAAMVGGDNDTLAFLDIRPATEGHIQVISKVHAPLFSMLPAEVRSKMFNVALNIGGILVQKLKATGVSYIINEGSGAGQRVAHASIQVIPRYEGDSVTIGWEEKQLSQEEINSYLQNVIKKLQSGSAEEGVKEEPKTAEEKPPKMTEEEEAVQEIEERIPKYW